jgi:predicted DNA-binding transcriptional regulator AlpA
MSTFDGPLQRNKIPAGQNESPSRRTYTIREVAEMFTVCTRTVRRRYQDGTFPSPIRGLGRVVRFDAAAVESFRQQCNPK